MKRQITADTLRELPKSKVNELFEALGPRKVEELKHDWNFWARDNQLAPKETIGTLGLLMLVEVSVRHVLE